MKKAILVSLHFIGRSISWRWLALISGVALMTAFSGKADKNKVSTDAAKDTERVTCYEPVADTSVIKNKSSNSVSKKEVMNAKDTSAQENQVTVHKCYVPIKPQE